jgi:tRNA threonylcarbamoyl adenosine modification protein (Sua5/YciO/YrdC/YwlC family)
VLESTKEVPRVLLHRRTTIGIRIPDHAFCQKLIELLGCPIVTTTAAAPGADAPLTDPVEIEQLFKGRVDVVVDGGLGDVVPSTVVQIGDGAVEVLRPGKGPFPRED